MSQQEGGSEKAGKKGVEAESEDDEVVGEKALRQSDQIRGSMQLTAKLWGRNDQAWSEGAVDTRHSSLGQTVPQPKK